MIVARDLIEAAHGNDLRVVFIQEIHRSDLIDSGRELNGDENVDGLGAIRAHRSRNRKWGAKGNHILPKRHDPADLETLLRGLKADTLMPCGELNDICGHAICSVGAQSDDFCRVAAVYPSSQLKGLAQRWSICKPVPFRRGCL